ncbi:MAG: hypothetical protein ABUK01_06605 [Leptospirales bacterium]
MNDLAVKNEFGKYILSDLGDRKAYISTTEKLSKYYMVKALKRDAVFIQSKLKTLHVFLESNFNNLNDFLTKLDLLSEFLEEKNSADFSKFMGKYFLSTLEKEKAAILTIEVPKISYKFDNPYYAPGNDMLLRFAQAFQKAPPLSALPESSSTDTDAGKVPAPVKKIIVVTPADPMAMPGKHVLERFTTDFASAAVLDLSKKEKSVETSVTKRVVEKKTSVVTIDASDMPGLILLKKFGPLFHGAPILKEETEEDAKVTIPSAVRTISFQMYVNITNKMTRFSRNKDQNGYKQWYITLSKEHRIALQINNLINKEKDGPVQWNAFFHKITYMEKIDVMLLERIKFDIEYYKILLIKIKTTFQKAITQGEPIAQVQALYAPLVKLLDLASSSEEKAITLQMTLLQLSNANAKEYLKTELLKLISEFDSRR